MVGCGYGSCSGGGGCGGGGDGYGCCWGDGGGGSGIFGFKIKSKIRLLGVMVYILTFRFGR